MIANESSLFPEFYLFSEHKGSIGPCARPTMRVCLTPTRGYATHVLGVNRCYVGKETGFIPESGHVSLQTLRWLFHLKPVGALR